ncbi:uncharacterized protein B0H64DRAFT_150752 [Chaetomium fimeti]|uniref:Uncharacterized protein n=1 Tax=Chaetomium fimeti TaxID=1854472 RepID=A0AAE0LRY2_9PEZI|nr:hypothetical protein B0H64DRAFT_150752 [Chaetomium fimeti]
MPSPTVRNSPVVVGMNQPHLGADWSDRGNPTQQFRPWRIRIGINTNKLSEAHVGCQKDTRMRHQDIAIKQGALIVPDRPRSALPCFFLAKHPSPSSLGRTPGIPLFRSGPERFEHATSTRGYPCTGARRSVQCHSHPFQCPQPCRPERPAGHSIPTCRFGAGRTTMAPRRRAPRDPDAFLSAVATFSRGAHIQTAGRTPVFVFVEFSPLSFSQVVRFPICLLTSSQVSFVSTSCLGQEKPPVSCQQNTRTHQTHPHIQTYTPHPKYTNPDIGRPDNTAAATSPSFRLRPSHPTIRSGTTVCSPTPGFLRFTRRHKSWNAIVSAPNPVTQSHEHGC